MDNSHPHHTAGHHSHGYHDHQHKMSTNNSSEQYSDDNISRYELIFGKQFVSTGGQAIMQKFASLLKLVGSEYILDFGCGLGGSVFYLAHKYGVKVLGVDVSGNMIRRANAYLHSADSQIQQKAKLEMRDVTTDSGFPPETFDCIIAREVIVHIQDKKNVFERFHTWLKPGGRLLIVDYFLGPDPDNPEFQEYVRNRHYAIIPLNAYEMMLKDAGFSRVETTDLTKECMAILSNDVKSLRNRKEEILRQVQPDEYDHILEGWEKKLERCTNGNQGWGLVIATK